MSTQLDVQPGAVPRWRPADAESRRFKVDALAVVAAAVLLGHAPLVALHLRSLWQREQYQYFPFVIAAVIGLLIMRWSEAPAVEDPPRWRRLPWLVLALSALLLGGALLLASAWLAMFSLNIALGATFLWLRQRRAMTSLLGVWLLLWLLVPAPLSTDDRLIQYLQAISSRISSMLLDTIGVMHVMAGNVLTVNGRELFVDEACSGIISVMSIIALSMIYAVWQQRTMAHLIALTLLGVVWAMIMNVLRICSIAVAEYYWQYDLASDSPYHGALSLAVFLGTFAALICTDQLLLGMLAAIQVDGRQQRYGSWMATVWNRFIAPHSSAPAGPPAAAHSEIGWARLSLPPAALASAAFLGLGVLQLVWSPSPDTAEAAQAVERALACDADSLPAQIGPWRREKFDTVEREVYSDFGRYSRSYVYRHARRPQLAATVSLDFPYLGGWHDLSVCYRNAGWTIEERSKSGGSDAWPYVDARLSRDDRTARALYACFDVSGEGAEPATSAVLFRPWFRLRRRLLLQLAPQLFQVQVFAEGDWSDDPDASRELQELLMEARTKLRRIVATPSEGGA